MNNPLRDSMRYTIDYPMQLCDMYVSSCLLPVLLPLASLNATCLSNSFFFFITILEYSIVRDMSLSLC